MADTQPQTTMQPSQPGTITHQVPGALRIFQVLLVVSAIFYILGGIAGFALSLFLGLFMMAWAAVALLVVWGIHTRRTWAYYVSITLLGVGIISSIVPKLSILTLAVDGILLVFIVKQRSYFTVTQAK